MIRPLSWSLLLLLSICFTAFGGVVYTYSGLTMTCQGTCTPAGPYAITANLEFSSALTAGTEYYSSDFALVYGNPAGGTGVAGLLTFWSLSDGFHTESSAAPPWMFLLYLQTDAGGNIASWLFGTQTDPAMPGFLTLISDTTGRADPTVPGVVDQSIHQVIIGEATDTSWVKNSAPGTWSAGETSAVPEPGTLALAGLALCALALRRHRASR